MVRVVWIVELVMGVVADENLAVRVVGSEDFVLRVVGV